MLKTGIVQMGVPAKSFLAGGELTLKPAFFRILQLSLWELDSKSLMHRTL